MDEEFHASIQEIYAIDQGTNKGKVAFGDDDDDEKMGGGVVEYMRGPIVTMERADTRAKNEFGKEP